MKSVLISIRPKWCEKIASGKKTIEVRKTAPKEVPFKAYIYCTKGKDGYEWLYRVDNNGYGKARSWHGKVIGEFICDKAERFSVGSLRSDDIEKLACLSYNEMINYFYKPEELDGKTVKQGFAWHISDLKIYDKPKELSEFYKPCEEKYYCEVCKHGSIIIPPDEEEYALYHGGFYEHYETVCHNVVNRPPQSWQYVEELK